MSTVTIAHHHPDWPDYQTDCDNCGEDWPATDLQPISDIEERLEPGGVVPAGQCPTCRALCYADTFERITIVVPQGAHPIRDLFAKLGTIVQPPRK